MTDDFDRRADQARDAVRMEAEQAAGSMPTAGALAQRAIRRRKTRRGTAMLGVIVFGSLLVATTWGNEPRSTVTASAPDDSEAGTPLPSDLPATVAQGTPETSSTSTRPATTNTSAPPSTTTTTPPPEGANDGVWIVGVDGSGLRRIADLQLSDGTSGVQASTWSPDGRFVALASGDEVRVVSVADSRVVRNIAFHPQNQAAVRCLDWSAQHRLAWLTTDTTLPGDGGPDGTVWIAGPDDSEARVIDTGRFDKTVDVNPTSARNLCAWSPDGSQLAVGGKDFRLYDPNGMVLATTPLDAAIASISDIAWSPDGTIAVGVAHPKLDGAQRSDQVWVNTFKTEPRLWPSPKGARIYRLYWAWDRSDLYLRAESTVQANGELVVGGYYSIDTETGHTELLTNNPLMALQAGPGGKFVGLTTTHSLADTAAVFDSAGNLQSVVTQADPRLPDDRTCPGSFFSSLDLSPAGDQLLLTARTRFATWRCDYSPPG